MTSKEIAELNPAFQSTNSWLKEIALQLALLNEKTQAPAEHPLVAVMKTDFPGKITTPKAPKAAK